MWWHWLKHRLRELSTIVVFVLIIGILVLLVMSGTGLDVRFLGNATAPREAVGDQAGVMLPRSTNADEQPGTLPDPERSILDLPLAERIGPQSIAEAQASWSSEDLARHQEALLAALNCARKTQDLPNLSLDPTLSQQAGEVWLRLVRSPSWSLADLEGGYALRAVLPLDLEQDSAQSGIAHSERDMPTCAIGGVDLAAFANERRGTAVGIAVFPPQASWDIASAVVLVK
jgi:hypothetical protein